MRPATSLIRCAAVLASVASAAPAAAMPADGPPGHSFARLTPHHDPVPPRAHGPAGPSVLGRSPETGLAHQRYEAALAQQRYYASFGDEQVIPPPSPPSPPLPAADRFDWGDAAIGAGGAIGVVIVSLGGAVGVRRRQLRARVAAMP
jgi:hypothetical protein